LVSQAVYRMRFTKYVLGKRGIANAPAVRAPLPELDEFTRLDIDNMLSDLQVAFP
jgi:4-hydroxy-tetrahydrodipicolinate synthase